ncbi:MAG TPA: O-antigen ligase family protein [Pirellula sp.]|nr:O-antigen ligase family protein [Pirellula sp.]
MSKELDLTRKLNSSWVYVLPSQLACFLVAVCLVSSQINPCDATSVSLGSSLTFILLTMGIGIFAAIDSVLTPSGIGFQPVVFKSQSGSLCHIQNRTVNGRALLCSAFVLFGFWLWLCTTLVPGRGNARFAYNGCWQWIAQGILTLSIVRLSSRYRIASTLIALMLSSAAGTVAYTSYQYFISMPALRQRFATDPNSLFAELGAVAGSSEAMQLSNRLASLEPTGPFALTNSLAGLMAIWLVFLVLLLGSQAAAHSVLSRMGRVNGTALRVNWISTFLSVGLMGSFFVTLLLTKSRSAWLATIVCLLASGFFHPTLRQGGRAFAKRFRHWMAAFATLCILSIGGVLIRDPMIVAEAGKSLSYRFDYWRGAIALIRAEPWTGYGVANFQQNYNRVKVITASESPADPHNFVFETAAAGGLPLLAILIAILTILFLKMLELSRSQREHSEGPLGGKAKSINSTFIGGFFGCVGILLFGLFNSDGDTLVSSILFIGVACLAFVLIERSHWLTDDQQIRFVSLLSASVMFVHLLASGGWMQPGVMNSVCVLVGIAFGTYSIKIDNVEKTPSGRVQLSGVFGLLIMTIAAVDFARTMCMPVLSSAAIVSAVSNNPTAVQEPSQWLEIVKIDPFDLDLPSLAANRCVEVLQRSDLSSTTRQKYNDVFDACCKEYVKRDPNQWTSYAECGKWNAVLAESERNQGGELSSLISRIELANDFFAKAADLYPSSVQTQLQAAVGALWCGKNTEAKLFISQAENIDQQTQHTDRKLAAAVVFFPKQLETAFAPLERHAKIEKQPGYAKGEPILQWLRTNVP